MNPTPYDTLAIRIARSLADRIIDGTINPDTPLRQDHVASMPLRKAFRQL